MERFFAHSSRFYKFKTLVSGLQWRAMRFEALFWVVRLKISLNPKNGKPTSTVSSLKLDLGH